MKSNLILLVVFTTVLTSCAPKSKSSNNVSVYKRQSIHPIIIKKQFEKCPRIYAQSTNSDFELKLYLNGFYTYQKIDFSGVLVGDSLRSQRKDIITSTESSFKDLKTYAMTWKQYDQLWYVDNYYKQQIINSGSSVSICRGYKDYSQTSIESASLSVNHVITKTNKAIKEVYPDIKIPTVDVKITPLLGKKYIGKKNNLKVIETKYDTDNAFYSPLEKSISFLPQSKEGLEEYAFGGIPLWEIPMVGAHEYGHHIFSTLYPRYKELYTNNGQIHQHDEYCFNSGGNIVHANHDGFNQKEQTYRVSDYKLLVRAINEGFADLVSFYSLDDNERKLTNITCMESTREVGSSHYADGTAKVFNYKAASSFYSISNIKDDGNCYTPNFQSIHHVGAIFAHATDSLLSVYTNDKKIKLKVVLKWLQNLNANHDKVNSANKFSRYNIVFSLMAKTILEEFKVTENSFFCNKIKTYFPSTVFSDTNNFVQACRFF